MAQTLAQIYGDLLAAVNQLGNTAEDISNKKKGTFVLKFADGSEFDKAKWYGFQVDYQNWLESRDD